MDIAGERNFGLVRGATSAHIHRGLEARSDKEPGQKSLSREGFAENGPICTGWLDNGPQQKPSLFKSCPIGFAKVSGANQLSLTSRDLILSRLF
jgi:hypothetical protein